MKNNACFKTDGSITIVNANVVDVEACTVRRADVVMRDGTIESVREPGAAHGAGDVVDAGGAYILPGFIDAHVHVESSHLVPSRFGALLAAHGTTTAICDPHEIVNVAGESGLDFMLADAKASPCDLFFMLPSCVPATAFETSGANLTAEDTERILRSRPELLGLGEMMDVPGVLSGQEPVIRKIAAAKRLGKRVDGHFPLASGEALRRYAAAGISSDHESVSAAEALEKVGAGMAVLIREGGSARNLASVLPAVTDGNFRSFCFCIDDASARFLEADGDILPIVRKAIALGLDPVRAVAIATINAARHYGLSDRGAVREGMKADLVVVRDLRRMEIAGVYKNGRPVASPGTPPPPPRTAAVLDSVHPRGVTGIRFPVPPPGASFARVMEVLPTELVTPLRKVPVADIAGLARLAVLDRYGVHDGAAYGLAAGTGLKRGAVAQTIAHDSHNLIVIGADDLDMRAAARRVAEIGGGVAVVQDGAVIGEFPLPYGGLMTDLGAAEAAKAERVLTEAIRKTGVTLPSPVITLAFLSLPVIPELKITDRGLVDVGRRRFVPLYE